MKYIFKYFKSIIDVHILIIKVIISEIERITPPNISCFLCNVIFYFKKIDVKFIYDRDKHLYYVVCENDKHYFSNKMRGINLYSKGLKYRSETLAASYFINNIEFVKGDVVIECGANYADLFYFLKNKINKNDYYAFEPGGDEYKCIVETIGSGNIFDIALSNESGSSSFYMCSELGDSSIVEPEKYTDKIEVKTVRLEEFIEKNKFIRIKLLKIEAEGYEPEVIDGVGSAFNIIEYIAVDGGYERGKEKSQTMSYIANVLYKNNFEMVDINFKWGRAIYRNKSFKSDL